MSSTMKHSGCVIIIDGLLKGTNDVARIHQALDLLKKKVIEHETVHGPVMGPAFDSLNDCLTVIQVSLAFHSFTGSEIQYIQDVIDKHFS